MVTSCSDPRVLLGVGVGIGVVLIMVACAGCCYYGRCKTRIESGHARAKNTLDLLFGGARRQERGKDDWASRDDYAQTGWRRGRAFDFQNSPPKGKPVPSQVSIEAAGGPAKLKIDRSAQHPRRGAQLTANCAVASASSATHSLNVSLDSGAPREGRSLGYSLVLEEC